MALFHIWYVSHRLLFALHCVTEKRVHILVTTQTTFLALGTLFCNISKVCTGIGWMDIFTPSHFASIEHNVYTTPQWCKVSVFISDK